MTKKGIFMPKSFSQGFISPIFVLIAALLVTASFGGFLFLSKQAGNTSFMSEASEESTECKSWTSAYFETASGVSCDDSIYKNKGTACKQAKSVFGTPGWASSLIVVAPAESTSYEYAFLKDTGTWCVNATEGDFVDGWHFGGRLYATKDGVLKGASFIIFPEDLQNEGAKKACVRFSNNGTLSPQCGAMVNLIK
ncbi:MAG: hypothetical protein ACD_22C00081G0005 [uncultured bacterium]|nr:MAG: hypothetical protein ACD_22C00081G0005 [uncultured bacterium]